MPHTEDSALCLDSSSLPGVNKQEIYTQRHQYIIQNRHRHRGSRHLRSSPGEGLAALESIDQVVNNAFLVILGVVKIDCTPTIPTIGTLSRILQ